MFALIARTQQTTMLDGYIEYGAGDFDGQSSGHDYMGVSSQAQNEWQCFWAAFFESRSEEGAQRRWEQAKIRGVPALMHGLALRFSRCVWLLPLGGGLVPEALCRTCRHFRLC